MSLTVRSVVDQMYRYLRKEQRELPQTNPDLDDSLPEALIAINATLQMLAVKAPQFSSKQPRSAHFRAPATAAVTSLTNGGMTATCAAWPTGAAGCLITLPGDTAPNRILYTTSTVATLQFPYLGSEAAGNATIQYDSVDLAADTIKVYDPVRPRDGTPIRPANGKWNLQQPTIAREDYGRRIVTATRCPSDQAYYVDSMVIPGAGYPQLRLTLRSPVTAELVLGFEAMCSLGTFTEQDVFNEVEIPVPAAFTDSIFMPIVMMRWFGASVMRNVDAPPLIAQQEGRAMDLLDSMRPQARKPAFIYPKF